MSERDEGLSAVAATEPCAGTTSAPSAPPCLGGTAAECETLERLYADLLAPPAAREQLGVVTVRMPKRLHDALRAKAAAEGVSLNWLCVALFGGFPLHPMPPGYANNNPFKNQRAL